MLVSGHVRIDTEPVRENVTRDDVAAVLYALLHEPRSVRQILYVGDGDGDRAGIGEGLGGN
jgi:nucleoside-diphosphate-sugar epimerase